MLEDSNNDINLWKINVMQYSAVLTLYNVIINLRKTPNKKETKMVRIPTVKS